jgi:hypothetical protein
MPYFIALHPAAFTEEQLEGLARRRAEIPSEVTWRATWSAFDEGVTYCEWEAPDKASIERVFKDLEVPFRDIQAVMRFDPALVKMEAA